MAKKIKKSGRAAKKAAGKIAKKSVAAVKKVAKAVAKVVKKPVAAVKRAAKAAGKKLQKGAAAVKKAATAAQKKGRTKKLSGAKKTVKKTAGKVVSRAVAAKTKAVRAGKAAVKKTVAAATQAVRQVAARAKPLIQAPQAAAVATAPQVKVAPPAPSAPKPEALRPAPSAPPADVQPTPPPAPLPAKPADIKTQRILAALDHRELDRVPVGEFFWTTFTRRCQEVYGPDFMAYRHWDLDMIVVNPNMDPHITGIRVLEDTPDRKVLKTGFGATIESRSDCPMPSFVQFDTQTYEQMEALRFDDPRDDRRFLAAIDDQINSVGDAINLNLPSFADRVKMFADDFCVFGSVCEPHEMIWRIMGTDNVLLKIAEEPARIARFVERLGDFLVGIVEGQIRAAAGRLAGLYVWGDVAYDHGMFFSPDYWRNVYKPQVKRICDAVHAAGLKTIYHGCGDARVIYEDLIEAGVDAYNPLEAKAGLDVVELKRQFGSRWAFNGNIDVRVLATNDRQKVRREVLRKLNAAKGGGYILQSDHSVPHNVAPETYDYVIQLAREYGQYPLGLGEFDENV